jgi:dephospho-CoA kinase
MRVFALTGGIGSGKSTVARILADEGVVVVDADELARRAVLPGRPAFLEIQERWPAVVSVDGSLDRPALGRIVFSDEQARLELNAIVHPRVRELAEEAFAREQARGTSWVAFEIPLLFETGQEARFRPVIVVSCSAELQVARIMARDGLSREAAEARLAAQMPLSEKVRQADIVIENDGTTEQLQARTLAALSQVKNA